MAVSLAAPQKDLPVLFQFQQPTHNVAVFRGADLKNAIAAGLVKGFPGASGSAGAVATKQVVTPVVPAPVVRVAHPVAHPVVHPVAHPVAHPVVHSVVHPVVHPVVHRVHAPVVHPVVHAAPAPVVHPVVHTAPAVAYKPYVDPYADEPAVYNYEYAVKDDYTYNDFGASENRDGYLTQGQYSVALPDGRVQTVTYTVDGGAGRTTINLFYFFKKGNFYFLY